MRADDLVVTTGFTQSVALVAHALAARSRSEAVAFEEPSLDLHRDLVRAAGLRVVSAPVDEHGVRVDDLPPAALAVLTPNRQHPLGVTLAPERRTQLLDRARADGMLVLEDDYDGEFRYDGHPIAALQSLEPARVIYAGTAAKALAPGLRLGWLAVPEELRVEVVAAKELLDRQTGVLDQLAFAELLRSGGYDRHIRKMRLRYRRRRDVLLAALSAHLPGLEIAGAAAGLNLLLRLPDAASEQRALAALEARGVAVQGLADGGYYEGEPEHGLIVGYAATQEHAYAAAVDALVEALGNAGVDSTRPSARIGIALVAAQPRRPVRARRLPIANAAVA